MAQTDLKAGKPRKKDNSVACGEVSGLIRMDGLTVKGSISITFDEPLALDIMHKMLGDKPAGINDEVAVMVGEITNMVCGGAKNELSKKGYDFGMASPIVMLGKDHAINHPIDGLHLIMPFTSENGHAYIEFCFDK